MARRYWRLYEQNPPKRFLEVFLPRRYGVLFSHEELRRINEKTLSLSLKYLGTNTTTNSYILEIE